MFKRALRVIPRRTVTFQTFNTPNPNALKFVAVDSAIVPLENKLFEFTSSHDAIHSPLARQLFKLDGVRLVMLGPDFLTVNKLDHVNWAHLRPEVVELVDTFLTQKKEPVVLRDLLEEGEREAAASEYDSEVVLMIKELLETRIRPAIQDDGGDIEYKGFDEDTGTVFVKLQGACKSCGELEVTLRNGIELMLKHYIEEVHNVEQILDPEEEIALKEFERMEANLKKRKESPPPSL